MSKFLESYIHSAKSRKLSTEGTEKNSKTPEKNYRNNEQIILEFLTEKDVPPWYRGSSKFQIKAANSLFNALRDDNEQQTTHRVRGCLGRIGLNPLICKKDIKVLMHICGGNDLAFLWFLWEQHYKSGLENSYTVNEQLILSSIAHLDMITTLRELDRILPPPQPTKKEMARQERLQALEKKRSTVRKKYKPDYILPYFEKQTRPKPYGKPLTITMPDFIVSFGSYMKYKDKNFVISNESNRWYGNYKMQTSRRIINNILNEQIGNIFDDYAKISLNTETVRNLCEHHKTLEELEKNLETELKVIARKRCLKHLDTDEKRKEVTRLRIVEQLDRDVAKYMCKFKKLAEKTRLLTLSHVLSSECAGHAVSDINSFMDYIVHNTEDVCDTDEAIYEEECECEDATEKIHNRGDGAPAKLKKKKAEVEKLARVVVDNARKTTSKTHQGIGDSEDDDGVIRKCKLTLPKFAEKKRTSRASFGSAIYLNRYDFGHYETVSQKPSQSFFQAPKEHTPYQFNYKNIFRFKNSGEKLNVKEALVAALESGVSLVNRIEDAPADYNAPVKDCVHSIWKEQVAIKNEEIRKQEEEDLKRPRKTPLNYDLNYYDPEDTTLMHNLLKDALEYIAKDTRFVLASIPEAHKLPLLREWIYHRYGKVYTREDRFKELQFSIKIFRALDKITQNVPMPHIKTISNQVYVDYSCRNYLIKKANYIKKQYYDKLDANIMDQARIFWFAMCPYLCSNGPPRNTYFAYMPSRVLDITRFRLWKSSEYMDAKRARDHRRITQASRGTI